MVFLAGGREYALPLESVAEIVPMVALAPVPDAPAWLAGLLNLRGDALPVVDLRIRLGVPGATTSLGTPIVIAKSEAQGTGLIVDEVEEVVSVPTSGFSSPGEPVGQRDGLTAAVATSGDGLVLVLDVERLIADATSAAGVDA